MAELAAGLHRARAILDRGVSGVVERPARDDGSFLSPVPPVGGVVPGDADVAVLDVVVDRPCAGHPPEVLGAHDCDRVERGASAVPDELPEACRDRRRHPHGAALVHRAFVDGVLRPLRGVVPELHLCAAVVGP